MPIVKGGVWTNVEDEILKAAVSKYGKNQWARISSLLVRKAPKQCKARWYEWLDPGIKKVEWNREEDEKLLHLAKLLPTQWRTIAPIVGRTSTQCLERYQKLLDDAEAAENELGLSGPGMESSAPSADTVRRLRPGETDPDPETKPAKPDAIDMDEDEKEMLSEARARLANTQGKKAKRKQREKLLEETKRLSVLQKRRDLKAAGINIKLHHRKKGDMDYNADIPFEHKPALGFYDTTEEAEENERVRKAVDFKHINQKIQNEAAAAEERRTGKKRENETSNSTPSVNTASLEKLRKAEQLTKRRKLNLPGPQVSDRELEDIVKMGLISNEARDLAESGGENTASRQLLGQYSSVQTNQPARTPRTPAAQDNIALEANNLRALTSTQSSLLGAENTPLHGSREGTGYASVTPRARVAATPSSLGQLPGNATPRVVHAATTPLRTPHRDNLLLNSSMISSTDEGQLTLVDEQRAAKHKAAQLRSQFASLPAPKNDYELELPDEEVDEGVDLTNDAIEDTAERDARLAQARARDEAIAFQKRSLVVQRALPRPFVLDGTKLLAEARQTEEGPQRLIAEEMARLIMSDAIKYPLVGCKTTGRALIISDMDVDLMDNARALIAAEAGEVKPDLSTIRPIDGATYIDIYHGDDERELKTLEMMIPAINDNLQEEAVKTSKLEKKMGVVLGGYLNRSKLLCKKLEEASAALDQTYLEMRSFEALEENETAAIQTRLEVLGNEVQMLERIGAIAQARYQSLSDRKEEIMASMVV